MTQGELLEEYGHLVRGFSAFLHHDIGWSEDKIMKFFDVMKFSVIIDYSQDNCPIMKLSEHWIDEDEGIHAADVYLMAFSKFTKEYEDELRNAFKDELEDFESNSDGA